MTVHCEDCDNVHDRSLPAYRWICLAFPNYDAKGFVKRDELAFEPYFFCKKINASGDCSAFTPKRIPEENEK